MTGHWSDREPDETLEDWMLRVQISTLAARHARETRREAS